MGQRDYYTEFHEALAKAFAANDPKVRDAWLDLADFCRSKLPGRAPAVPDRGHITGIGHGSHSTRSTQFGGTG